MTILIEQKEYTLTEETISSISELGSVLEQIHKRLTSDGYTIINGKIKDNKCLQIVKKK
jgi:hypothetical protein